MSCAVVTMNWRNSEYSAWPLMNCLLGRTSYDSSIDTGSAPQADGASGPSAERERAAHHVRTVWWRIRARSVGVGHQDYRRRLRSGDTKVFHGRAALAVIERVGISRLQVHEPRDVTRVPGGNRAHLLS